MIARPNAIQAAPYEVQEPHGAILITLEGTVSVGGHTGVAIVKNNYLGDGVSKEVVANDPARYHDSVTVIFHRELGYDPDHQDWYWARSMAIRTATVSPGCR